MTPHAGQSMPEPRSGGAPGPPGSPSCDGCGYICFWISSRPFFVSDMALSQFFSASFYAVVSVESNLNACNRLSRACHPAMVRVGTNVARRARLCSVYRPNILVYRRQVHSPRARRSFVECFGSP